jgi:hypothetical protein
MASIVTDQFRILNASNFIDSVAESNNSYYVFVGLANPTQVGYGRTADWDTNVPNPVDSINDINHVYDNIVFGKKITTSNVRRLIRRRDWTQGARYEIYRHDYSVESPSPITQSSRLYDANYYVMNADYRVYICIDNGSSGINTVGNASQDQPTFTDLEPSKAGESGDGYVWKYLFTVSPSDIVKFDSTDYVAVPNNWDNSTDAQIEAIRENGDSSINSNQIKKVYIDRQGENYASGLSQEVNILGDGTGGKVVLDVVGGKITNAIVSAGGKGYSFGIVDLGSINSNVIPAKAAKLIPIIPPSKGHGYDLYKELGTDKVLAYARFDDSTKDFPSDSKFAQIGILKNPTSIGSTNIFTENQFSSAYALKFSSTNGTLNVGDIIRQPVTGGVALGYVVSYDLETKVVKYTRDRSLYFNDGSLDQTDYIGISTSGKVLNFESSATIVTTVGGFSGSVDLGFSGITTNPTGTKVVNLGVQFTNGVALPEINKTSGEIIYLDNRPLIARNPRQKEDIKIILEF